MIRYTKDNYSIDDVVDLIYKLDNSSIEGDFLIYIDPSIKNIKLPESKNRKIIIASYNNKLSEKNIGCVIDMMKEKRKVLTLSGGIRESITYISRSEALKRSIGKIVYRLISENTYNLLPEKTEDQIPKHYSIIDSILQKNRLSFDINFFLKNEIIDISMNVTSKGRLIRKLPFGLHPSILAVETSGYEGIVLASLIDNYDSSPFIFNVDFGKGVADYQLNLDAHTRKYFNRFRGSSDLETFLKIYIDYIHSKTELSIWCKNNFISFDYMNNVINSIEICRKIIHFKNIEIDVNELLERIHPIMQKLYSSQKIDLETEIFTQYIDSQHNFYSIDSLSINTIEEKRPSIVYSLITSSINDNFSISLCYVSPYESIINNEF